MARRSGIRNLRQDQVDAIIRSSYQGLSSQQASGIHGVSVWRVQMIWKRFKEAGSVQVKSSPGRPRITCRATDRDISRLARKNPLLSASEILREISTTEGVNPSVRTVRRRLTESGLSGRRPVKKPLLSKRNRKARLEWGQAHKDWTVEQWREVIWSDESKFLLFGTDGNQFIRRPVGTRYHHRYQLPTVKHGGGSVLVHGSFSGKGVGPLHWITGTMDSKMYLNIMENIVLPHARSMYPGGFIFQQDNDTKHKSKLVSKWFRENSVHLLPWPSQSPDLNPIEHLWDEIARQTKGLKARNAHEKFIS